MTKQEIIDSILHIKKLFYTPTSKIADECKIDRSILSKILNNSLEPYRKVPKDTFVKLENWLKERK